MALHILRRAQERGELRRGDVIVEASSGNTGVAFAAIGRALGHPASARGGGHRCRLPREGRAKRVDVGERRGWGGAAAEAPSGEQRPAGRRARAQVLIFMPDWMSWERRALITAYGAEAPRPSPRDDGTRLRRRRTSAPPRRPGP